jgi:hypothetical protein
MGYATIEKTQYFTRKVRVPKYCEALNITDVKNIYTIDRIIDRAGGNVTHIIIVDENDKVYDTVPNSSTIKYFVSDVDSSERITHIEIKNNDIIFNTTLRR